MPAQLARARPQEDGTAGGAELAPQHLVLGRSQPGGRAVRARTHGVRIARRFEEQGLVAGLGRRAQRGRVHDEQQRGGGRPSDSLGEGGRYKHTRVLGRAESAPSSSTTSGVIIDNIGRLTCLDECGRACSRGWAGGPAWATSGTRGETDGSPRPGKAPMPQVDVMVMSSLPIRLYYTETAALGLTPHDSAHEPPPSALPQTRRYADAGDSSGP